MDRKIRLLILAGTPGLYGNNNSYNGGGWVASLEKILLDKYSDKLDLGLAWPSEKKIEDELDGIPYFGIPRQGKLLLNIAKKENRYCNDISKIVNKFNPDAILCFGTENGLALVDTLTDIPVLIHIQGLLNPYFETWLPEKMSWLGYFRQHPKEMMGVIDLKNRMKREVKTMKACRYFLGRTDWDRQISHLISPNAKYHYCSEMLRPVIYNSDRTWRTTNSNNTIHITSVISSAVYKGGDVILRTAKVLKNYTNFDFLWNVYGVNQKSMSLWEDLTGIKSKDVNVSVNGVINAKRLIDVETSSDVCVHPSYIENSPNTVCEMQLLGCPVIATNCGGTSSLIKDGETGMLVPVNDPWTMATLIEQLATDKCTSSKLGANARTIALERHNPEIIVRDLMSAIKDTLNK